ncbi:mycofactocin radical SAM maturase [Nocardia fluminea]|uniref:mycofactocin radical SAM maturase n=1 Tax=Nocardia fluminea TaxID=134984 RepID=UPI0033F2EFEF
MSETILLRDDLDTSIRLRWELTDARNLSSVRWLSSRARRDPRELSTTECKALIDEFGRVGVSYADISGGEPTVREDFWDLLDHATDRRLSVGFCTSGIRITPAAAAAIATSGCVDVRIALDEPTEAANDAVGGPGAYRAAVRAMELLASSGVYDFELSVVATRHNVGRLDAFLAIADLFGARLRLSLPRPSARGVDGVSEEHLLPEHHRDLYRWLRDRGGQVRTGDWFVPLFGDSAPVLGSAVSDADGVACLVDPIGDVYIRPPLGYADLRAGNVRAPGGFERVWRGSADRSRHDAQLADDLRACS